MNLLNAGRPARSLTGRTSLVIDKRWDGAHGIGRYAREIVARLELPHRSLVGKRKPTALSDPLLPGRLRLGPSDLLYVPGFAAGPSRARQLLTVYDLIHLYDADESSRVKKLYYEQLVRPTIRKTGAVLTISPASTSRIREWLGPGPEIIDAGIGLSAAFHGRSASSDSIAVDSGAGLGLEPGYAMFVGPTRPHKDPETAVAAVAQVPGLLLLVVSRDVEDFTNLAVKHSMADRLRIMNGIDDEVLAKAYAGASCLILPSTDEGFGLPAAEAIACGTPVLYRRSCEAVHEVVGEFGLAMPAGSLAGDWSDGLRTLIAGPRPSVPADWSMQYQWDPVAARVTSAIQGLM